VIVGIPREIKDNEYRVAATPAGVRELTHAGHQVLIASRGLEEAVRDAPVLAKGVNVYGGAVTSAPVAEAHGREHRPLSALISGAPD
jgi:alanine dehydrogenase